LRLAGARRPHPASGPRKRGGDELGVSDRPSRLVHWLNFDRAKGLLIELATTKAI
jgi:hypothetical protein